MARRRRPPSRYARISKMVSTLGYVLQAHDDTTVTILSLTDKKAIVITIDELTRQYSHRERRTTRPWWAS